MKPISFLGDSLKRLREFPDDACHDAGYQLDKVQRGGQPDDFKPMPAVGKGVEEIRIWDDSGTYRVIYTGRLANVVVVLHAEQDASNAQARDRIGQGTMGATAEGTTMSKATASKKPKTYASVWEALADTPEQAANLRTRAELMQQIAAIVEESGRTQTEAADQCGVTQPRMNDLLRGRVSRFSLDALVNIATAIGRRVHFELEAA